MKKIKKWWAELPSSRKEQIYAVIGVLILGGLGIFLFSELIRELKPILPVLIFIPLFFGEYISDFFYHRKQIKIEQEQQQQAKNWADYEEIASFVVRPVVNQEFNTDVNAEAFLYTGSFNWGNGFYYQLPRICDSHDKKFNLQRKTERKLADVLKVSFADVAKKKMVSIYGDVMVIRIL